MRSRFQEVDRRLVPSFSWRLVLIFKSSNRRISFSMIRYLTAGESHGESLVGIVEGIPAGVPLTADDINEHLSRRWLGFGRGGRARIEKDLVHIYSGIRFSRTLGSPIALRLDNSAYEKDRSGWPEIVGTVSGDDTIFIASRTAGDQQRLLTRLRARFPAEDFAGHRRHETAGRGNARRTGASR